MAQPELDRLLISNLADLDAAAYRIKNVLHGTVASALDSRLKYAIERSGWAGHADYEHDKFWIAAPDWRRDSDDLQGYECYFHSDSSDGAWSGVEFWLTVLLGGGTRLAGFRWIRRAAKRKSWRKQVSEQVDIIARLRSRGFEFQESTGTFFMPFRIDKDALASAVGEESPELAMAPFDMAVQSCISAKADFDALIEATPQE